MITAEQKEFRKTGLFSSDIARIMCGDSVRVALEKIGAIEEEDIDDVAEIKLGKIIEPSILTAYELQTGSVIERSPEDIHPKYPWMGAHPDGKRPDRRIEAKTVGVYNIRLWGNSGTDQVPLYPLWQATAQTSCADVMFVDVVACFLTLETLKYLLLNEPPPIYLYRVPRDFTLEKYMIEKCEYVWGCIKAGRTPRPEKPSDVKLIYSKGNGTSVEATDEITQYWQTLLEVQADKKDAETKEENLKFVIQSYMKEANVLTRLGRTLATWNNDSDGTKVDLDRLEEKWPEAYKDCLVPRPGPRKFLPKKVKP